MKRAIVITGSTKGIGKATAIKALESNYFVYLNYAHDENAAAQCAKILDSKGYADSYKIIKADISDIDSLETFVSQIDFEQHMLSGVVLNAASNGITRNTFAQITPVEMETMFRINLFAPFFLVQKLADKICDGGAIVFVSSHVGIYPHSTYIPYGLTKFAEIFLAKMLVKEFSARKVTVNAVAPAFIETEMFPGKRTREHLENIQKKIAIHRFGKPEEVAKAIMSALENPYMNGNIISLDGGYNYQ